MANAPDMNPNEAMSAELFEKDFEKLLIRRVIAPEDLLQIERSSFMLPSARSVRLTGELQRTVESTRLCDTSQLFPFTPKHPWDQVFWEAARRLPSDFAAGWRSFPAGLPVDASFSVPHEIAFASARGPLISLKAADGRLIVLDSDRFASLVLTVLLLWLGGDSGAHLAIWLIVHQALELNASFPESEYLIGEFHRVYPESVSTVADKLAQLLIGHEIGHSYPGIANAGFLELLRFENLPDSEHAPGRWAESSDLHGLRMNLFRGEDDIWRLVWPSSLDAQREELACDVFALWASTAALAGRRQEKPSGRHFNSMLPGLVFWQIIAFIYNLRDRVREGFGPQASTSDQTAARQRYPRWRTRVGVLSLHLTQIGDFLDPGWASTHVTVLNQVSDALWDKTMADASDKTGELFYQLANGVGPTSNPDRYRHVDGRPLTGRVLGIYESLWWECIRPNMEAGREFLDGSWASDLRAYNDTWSRHVPEMNVFAGRLAEVGNLLNDNYYARRT